MLISDISKAITMSIQYVYLCVSMYVIYNLILYTYILYYILYILSFVADVLQSHVIEV